MNFFYLKFFFDVSLGHFGLKTNFLRLKFLKIKMLDQKILLALKIICHLLI